MGRTNKQVKRNTKKLQQQEQSSQTKQEDKQKCDKEEHNNRGDKVGFESKVTKYPILSSFYVQLLCAQIPKAQKRLTL